MRFKKYYIIFLIFDDKNGTTGLDKKLITPENRAFLDQLVWSFSGDSSLLGINRYTTSRV